MANSIGVVAINGLHLAPGRRLPGMRAALAVAVLFAAAIGLSWFVRSADDPPALFACLAASLALLFCASILTPLWTTEPTARMAIIADAISLLAIAMVAPTLILDDWRYAELTAAVLVAIAGTTVWVARVVSGESAIRSDALKLGAVLTAGTCVSIWLLREAGWLQSVEMAAVPIALTSVPPLFSSGVSSRHPLGIALGVATAAIILTALVVIPDHELILTVVGMIAIGGLVASRARATPGAKLESAEFTEGIAGKYRSGLTAASLLVLIVLSVGLDDPWRWLAVTSFAMVAIAMISAQGASLVVHERLFDRLVRLVQETASQARLDPLTRLPNRAALDARLREEVERAIRYRQPTSILFIDVDHFKSINDEQGHDGGDRALREIGSVIRATIRTPDFAARFGGEEFVVIAPGTWSTDATVLGRRIQAAVGTSIRHANGESVTVSVGIAGVPEHALAPDEVMRSADLALYRAKDAGRNRVEIASAAPRDQDLRDNS
jgi:diguanylate cyclase (GGDEF)-like protein